MSVKKVKRNKTQKNGNGSLRIILSIASSMCGSSILTLPYGFYIAGLIGGPLLSLVAMLLMGLTDSWILKSQHICRKHNENIKKSKILEEEIPEQNKNEKIKETAIELSSTDQQPSVCSSAANLIPYKQVEHSQYLISTSIPRSRRNSRNIKTNKIKEDVYDLVNEELIKTPLYINNDNKTINSSETTELPLSVATTIEIESVHNNLLPNISIEPVNEKNKSRKNSIIYNNNNEKEAIELNNVIITNDVKFSANDCTTIEVLMEKNLNEETGENKNISINNNLEKRLKEESIDEYIPNNLKFDEKDFPVKEEINISDFSTIAQALTSTVFGYILSIASFIIMFAVATSYSIFLIDMVTGIACNFGSTKLPVQGSNDPYPWCPVESLTEITYMRFVIASCFAIILYGLASVINMATIIKIASFGFIAYVVLIVYMIVFASTDAPGGKWSDVQWKKELFKPNALKFLGISMLNFAAHNTICNVMAGHQVKKNIIRDSWISFMLAWIIATLVGMVGYISFIANKGGVPQNFSSILPYNGFAIAVRVFLCFNLIVVYPIVQKVLRTNIILWIPSKLCKKESYKNCCARKSQFIPYDSNKKSINLIINLIVILITFPVAVFYPQVGSVLGIAGSVGGGIYCLLAPSLVWRTIKIITHKWKRGLIAIIILIVIFGCTAIAMQFVTI